MGIKGNGGYPWLNGSMGLQRSTKGSMDQSDHGINASMDNGIKRSIYRWIKEIQGALGINGRDQGIKEWKQQPNGSMGLWEQGPKGSITPSDGAIRGTMGSKEADA